jgi:hypothetical protein
MNIETSAIPSLPPPRPGFKFRLGRNRFPGSFVHLVLSDGRELYASPGHTLLDGKSLGTLTVGDRVGGASVIGVDPVLSFG